MSEIPEAVRRAMEARGVDIAAVEEALAGDPIPPDERAVEEQMAELGDWRSALPDEPDPDEASPEPTLFDEPYDLSDAERAMIDRARVGNDLEAFVQIAEKAREAIEPGVVSWRGSPFAWMLSNGPVTKNMLGRRIIQLWLSSKGIPSQEGQGGTFGHHFVVRGRRVAVHFGLLGKEGELRFSALREPEMGIDEMYLLGIEPRRARLWVLLPNQTETLPAFSGDVKGLHSLAFDPDDVPPFLREIPL